MGRLAVNDAQTRLICRPYTDWVKRYCVRLLRTKGIDLKHAVLVSLRHLVRIHRRLSLATLMPRLDNVEAEGELAGEVGTLREEIQIYMYGHTND